MKKIKLGKEEYRNKVLACWLGKNIGGTLGAPHEGKKYVHNFTFYEPVPEKPLPNDDLDFQLVWLKMLEDRGANVTFTDFSNYWLKYLSAHWYNEYSLCIYNLQRGLRPPISGAFQNYWVDEMGSPIRSEIWACIAPADPQLAATMAWMDASLDHTGGEGRWGEMFWAAAESAAFVIDEPKTLIQIGLSMIPISCQISRVIREAVWCHESGIPWGEARERIATIFGHHQPCNAIPNHGFTIIGLLYGKNYGDKLCKAVNCGYDTDCTGATLGSLLGIMYGKSYIPDEWLKVVGDAIITCEVTVKTGLPKSVSELTERTVKIAEKFLAERSDITELSQKTVLPDDLFSLAFRNENVRELLNFDNNCAVETIDGTDIIFHYGGEPILYPGRECMFEISVRKNGSLIKPVVEIKGPPKWSLSKPVVKNNHLWFTACAREVENKNIMEITVKTDGKIQKAKFVILGPNGIKSIAAATFAPKE